MYRLFSCHIRSLPSSPPLTRLASPCIAHDLTMNAFYSLRQAILCDDVLVYRTTDDTDIYFYWRVQVSHPISLVLRIRLVHPTTRTSFLSLFCRPFMYLQVLFHVHFLSSVPLVSIPLPTFVFHPPHSPMGDISYSRFPSISLHIPDHVI